MITPFIKPLLVSTAQMIKNAKLTEMSLRLSLTNAITQFFEAILDYNSSQSTKPENKIKIETFNTEADVIYENLFGAWLNSARDRESKVSVLSAISSTTSFISTALLKEKCTSFVLSILQMYKRLGVSNLAMLINERLSIVKSGQSQAMSRSKCTALLKVLCQPEFIIGNYFVLISNVGVI